MRRRGSLRAAGSAVTLSRVRGYRRAPAVAVAVALAGALAGCGGGGHKLHQLAHGSSSTATETVTVAVPGTSPRAVQQLGFPALATRNTTRVPGADPIADAAGVAVAVYPSAAPGTHPKVVTLAPTDDWEAAIASSVLMAPPIGAPVLLSGASKLAPAAADALRTLAPTGSGQAAGAQLIRIGDVPAAAADSASRRLKPAAITGAGPYALAAAIDRFATAAAGGKASADVVVASSTNPAYAMPAAGWAAESGDPVLFVAHNSIPAATVQALQSHQSPSIYALGPPSVISNGLLKQLGRYGTVKRVGAPDPAASSVAFTVYRDPPCPADKYCVHVPNSFGWAIRSPGHGYTLLNASRPLDAAASAALSGSGDFDPQLVTDEPTTLPKSVLNFFGEYATPGYTQEGPTAAVYNHGWIIGDPTAISVSVQAELDDLLQAIPTSVTK